MSSKQCDPPQPHLVQRTDDSVKVLRFAASAFDAGIGAAVVTLVYATGTTRTDPMGSQIAVRGDAGYVGSLSDRSVEAAVAVVASALVRGDASHSHEIGSDFSDFTLPCGGTIKVAIHVLTESEATWQAASSLMAKRQQSLRTDSLPRHGFRAMSPSP